MLVGTKKNVSFSFVVVEMNFFFLLDVTVGMLVLLGYAQNLRMGNLVKSVSFYFDQGDRATAQLGALVAEAVSSKLDKEPLNTGLLEGEPKLLEWKKIIFNAKESEQK